MLTARHITAGYGKSRVLFDVSIDARRGEVITVLGHNGAGKTTLLKTIAGIVRGTGGEITVGDDDVTREAADRRVAHGISYSPAEAAVFRELSVADNLALGAFTRSDRSAIEERRAFVIDLFPRVGERLHQQAGTLSGGERRMVSIGMALMAFPRVLLLDEPSNGLSPAMVDRIFTSVRRLADDNGITVVLVEQNVRAALRISDRAYFLQRGSIVLEESAESALSRGQWWDLF
jgi:branched-chain amino acid transport system ATP-binding protein